MDKCIYQARQDTGVLSRADTGVLLNRHIKETKSIYDNKCIKEPIIFYNIFSLHSKNIIKEKFETNSLKNFIYPEREKHHQLFNSVTTFTPEIGAGFFLPALFLNFF